MADVPIEELLKAYEELKSTLREWKDEATKLAVDYNTNLRTVEATIIRLEATEKRWWVVYKPWIVSIGGLIAFILCVFALIGSGFCGTVNFPTGGSYTRTCTT